MTVIILESWVWTWCVIMFMRLCTISHVHSSKAVNCLVLYSDGDIQFLWVRCTCAIAVITSSYFCVVSASVDDHHWKQDSTAAEGQCASSNGYNGQRRHTSRYVKSPQLNAWLIHQSDVFGPGFTGVGSVVCVTATTDCPRSKRVQSDLRTRLVCVSAFVVLRCS